MSDNKMVRRIPRRLTAAFLVLALGNEAFHAHEASHGNRRERLEEMRIRLEEVATNHRPLRMFRSHPNPPPETPQHRELAEELRRRRLERLAGIKGAGRKFSISA